MTKILVTGATGFIGSELVRDLVQAKYNVVALVRWGSKSDHLTRLGSEIRYADIRDLRSLVKAISDVNTVVHLAAMSSSEGTKYERSFEINVVGTQNLIDACKVNKVRRIIFLGTQSDNRGAYATTKREAEELLKKSGLDVTVLKPSLVYGPGAKGLFGNMIKFIRRFPVIPLVGSGKYPMKPIYIGDVTKVIIGCLERNNLRTEYYISGPAEITYAQFMDEIAMSIGVRRMKLRVPYFLAFLGVLLASTMLKGFPITTDTLKGLVNPRVHDSEEARRDFGFNPIPLDEGLRRTSAQVDGKP